jgi:hypothetical protein
MNFQIFLNLVGTGTVLKLGSRNECARAEKIRIFSENIIFNFSLL